MAAVVYDVYGSILVVTTCRIHVRRYQPLPRCATALEVHHRALLLLPLSSAEVAILEIAWDVADTEEGEEG